MGKRSPSEYLLGFAQCFTDKRPLARIGHTAEALQLRQGVPDLSDGMFIHCGGCDGEFRVGWRWKLHRLWTTGSGYARQTWWSLRRWA